MDHRALHWRPLAPPDLPAVEAIAAAVHPDFFEDTAVFAERQRLYPDGARLLELDGAPAGYLISHPWHAGAVPALNAPLGAIPSAATSYYLHDLALLNRARGTGAAAMIVGAILDHARALNYPGVSLVAVNGSQPFWYKHGFRALNAPGLAAKLASYEPAARFMVKALV